MSLAQLGINTPSSQIHASVNRLTSPTFAQPSGLMDARMVAARLPGLAMYGAPYSAPNFPGYLPYGPAAAAAVVAAADPASIYPPMGAGESADAWRAGMNQATAAAAYYDPAAMAAHFSYGYGPMGFNDGARRKNATRETTSTLKAWLNEHRKNPYPTKGEKIMLAIITKMTLTQVSTWFANARRRLKKENKMTWSPRNRCGEDDDEDDLLDDGLHSNHVNDHSRSSTPNELADHQTSRPDAVRFNGGHTSCGESLSDEGQDDSMRNQSGSSSHSKLESVDSDHAKELTSSMAVGRQLVSRHQSEYKARSSHFIRHSIHPYASQRMSPTAITQSQGSLPSPIQAAQRPGIPFPAGMPPHGVHSMNPHSADSRLMQGGQFNPAAAASLLAASRRHPLPPHVMAALSEQAQLHHYQQALQQLPMHQYISNERKASSTHSPSPTQPRPSSTSPNNVRTSSPKEVSSTKSPSTPTKSKIWSIAEVATSSETSKSSKSPVNNKSPPAPQHPELPKGLSHVQSWMDSMLQQKLAAVMASAGNVHNGMGMTPQQLQQLASMHSGQNSFIPPSGARTTPQFPTFPELIAMQSFRNTDSGSISPEANSPQLTRSVTSPVSSHHSEATSSHEMETKKRI